MHLEHALGTLRQLRDRLEARGIARAAIFGSIARGEASAGSDVDVIVTPLPGRRLDLIDLGGVQSMLDEAFGELDVDLVVEPVKKPDLLDAIQRDRVHAF